MKKTKLEKKLPVICGMLPWECRNLEEKNVDKKNKIWDMLNYKQRLSYGTWNNNMRFFLSRIHDSAANDGFVKTRKKKNILKLSTKEEKSWKCLIQYIYLLTFFLILDNDKAAEEIKKE